MIAYYYTIDNARGEEEKERKKHRALKSEQTSSYLFSSLSYLSIIAPAYNEELVIREVVEEWENFIKKEKLSAEIVACNDGSTDKTGEILAKLQKKFSGNSPF